ncbi:uncharacterized protein LOC116263405 isoform X2 [Nymphaea colorata]|uniref:uncharacterized protein LOC116263405 isoform X2 n=1 Tax=Nymphaea colorata TaxID=210225 RepID=UPI00129E571B|nr:uncharacterized protein LOC116263405 isoform X2 [Nymphaea colorata]
MAAIEWYGPLIDLSDAASHVGDYVQLLVLVRACRSYQESKSSRSKNLLRTCTQVGDNTNPQFSILSWDKQIFGKISAGDIVLMQNVDKLVMGTKLGSTTKDKLKVVINWARESRIYDLDLSRILQPNVEAAKNWKINGEKELRHCTSISEVLCLNHPCHVKIHGYIGDINVQKLDGSFYSIDKRFSEWENNILDCLICQGCKVCGAPTDSCLSRRQPSSFYCEKSSSHFHEVCWIYKPFQIYVWDDSGKVSLTVKNRAAEILFGNITAESVKLSFQRLLKPQDSDHPMSSGSRSSNFRTAGQSASGDESDNNSRSQKVQSKVNKRTDFFKIWLILLKLLLLCEENSPFRFEVSVNCDEDSEHFALELVSFFMPYEVLG